MTGAPSTVNTSDFAICPTPTPTASAACCEVRASTDSSTTLRSRPSAVSAAWKRETAGFTRLECELGHEAERLDLADTADQRGHARRLPDLEPLADPLLGAAQRDLVHEGVGHRGRRLVLFPGEIEILDAPGRGLVAVAANEIVVEVPPPGSHAPHVQGEPGLDRGATGRHIVTNHHGHGGRAVALAH